ncbi:TetR/AcrR family transcriptional regulator [Superficieibacter sp. HKU1]|uniref:TetR/AcrR family transcriptional regulator n=1 Tax=Superficieibacter sp. HKU1 TaxID=3031919 RepID=UPI0023E24364|nr:TetR/AcrR family transcriptional regulator [Superficieibacter sp. HKU1]WES69697.1 TetR/AcrR family transcriptional regulator [Superficieibacter sp. HKU1]
MARPKSEDKKQALLEAATIAFAQSGITASTAMIARSAGVAEGTLFRYFATKDDLLNALYLHLKQQLCRAMLANRDPAVVDPVENTRYIWNNYIDWGVQNPLGNRTVRQLAVSEKITKDTKQQVEDMFPEMQTLCRQSILPVFKSEEFNAFGDACFLALAETTMEFATREPTRASEFKAIGFETMWRALSTEKA